MMLCTSKLSSLLLCSGVLLQYYPSEAWISSQQQTHHWQQNRITSTLSSPLSSLLRHDIFRGKTAVSRSTSKRATGDDDDGNNGFSRDAMAGDSSSSSSSRIIPAAMTGKSQLAAAFTALDESDQYDAVLTGLCAKILDNDNSSSGSTDNDNNGGGVNLDDPAALLTEMNERKIPASPRSLMALIDVSEKNAYVDVKKTSALNCNRRNLGKLRYSCILGTSEKYSLCDCFYWLVIIYEYFYRRL